MFNATLIVIEAFIRELRTMYERTYTRHMRAVLEGADQQDGPQ